MLRICEECHVEVDTSLAACPECGHPMNAASPTTDEAPLEQATSNNSANNFDLNDLLPKVGGGVIGLIVLLFIFRGGGSNDLKVVTLESKSDCLFCASYVRAEFYNNGRAGTFVYDFTKDGGSQRVCPRKIFLTEKERRVVKVKCSPLITANTFKIYTRRE